MTSSNFPCPPFLWVCKALRGDDVIWLLKKQPFMIQMAASHRSVRYNTDIPPFKVVPPS